jgi:hypothetical protein
MCILISMPVKRNECAAYTEVKVVYKDSERVSVVTTSTTKEEQRKRTSVKAKAKCLPTAQESEEVVKTAWTGCRSSRYAATRFRPYTRRFRWDTIGLV